MKKESVKVNFIYNIMYQILVLILPLITAPYLSRVMGGDSIGIYSYTQAFASYFVLLAMLGVENYGNREIARVRDNDQKRVQTFWNIFAVQFVLTIVFVGIYIGYLLIVQPKYMVIYFLQLFYVISAGFNVNWFFFGMEKFKLTVTRNLIIKVLTTACIFLFVKDSNDLWLYTLILSLGTLISNMMVWPFLRKYITFIKPSWSEVKKHIVPNLKLFIPVVAVSLYNIMDKLMLGSMATYTEVGFYTYAEKIVQVPVTVIIALGTVMMPHVSNLISNGEEEACKKLFHKAMLFVMFMSVAFTFGMANLAPVFSTWYYGKHFGRCGLFMMWLSPVIIFKSWANLVRTQLIIPYGHDNIYILSVSAGAVVNLIANIMLIPRMAGLGAIIGTICAEFMVCFIQFWKTRKQVNYLPYLKDGLGFGIIGCVMYCFMKVVGLATLSYHELTELIIRFACGTACYLLLSLFYIIYIKKEKDIINSIFKGVKKKLHR